MNCLLTEMIKEEEEDDIYCFHFLYLKNQSHSVNNKTLQGQNHHWKLQKEENIFMEILFVSTYINFSITNLFHFS